MKSSTGAACLVRVRLYEAYQPVCFVAGLICLGVDQPYVTNDTYAHLNQSGQMVKVDGQCSDTNSGKIVELKSAASDAALQIEQLDIEHVRNFLIRH